MADCCDSRRPVDVETDVRAGADHSVAGVQPHPHPYRHTLGPAVTGQGTLGLHRRTERPGGTTERGEKGVSLRTYRHSSTGPDRRSKQTIVLRQEVRVGVTYLLEQPGRALDVGEH